MDSITHIVLGAVIGDAIAGKQLGKKAMLIGAVAQSLPDIDFVLAIWLRPVDNLLAHRGFTHSLIFLISLIVLTAIIAAGRHKAMARSHWILFLSAEIGAHLLLDSMNNYGVGLFEPFFHTRVSWNVIYVADPFYSIWIGIGFFVLIFLPISSRHRRVWTTSTLVISSLYLVYALSNKYAIDSHVHSSLDRMSVKTTRVLTTPTPLNNWLWFVAAETKTGYHVAHVSVFDRDTISFTYFPRQEFLANELKDREDFDKLLRFSQGYYTLQKYNDALLFNDLRFGQIAGWSDKQALFAFHYDLYHPDANLFVVQQGRFSNWNEETVKVLVKRILGHSPGNDK